MVYPSLNATRYHDALYDSSHIKYDLALTPLVDAILILGIEITPNNSSIADLFIYLSITSSSGDSFAFVCHILGGREPI